MNIDTATHSALLSLTLGSNHLILANMNYDPDDLVRLLAHHSSIACIDSDGCVFNTMDVKQKQFFHPHIIKKWQLEAIDPYVRETAEFVTLNSQSRGLNRFIAIVEIFDLLSKRPEVQSTGVRLPATEAMHKVIDAGPLGHEVLEAEISLNPDPFLVDCLQWSKDINADLESNLNNIPPFQGVERAMDLIQQYSDAIVVTQTQTATVQREWAQNGLEHRVALIAGPERGTKIEHIRMATENKYKAKDILMIGDAPGDLNAARKNKALFYPIIPGQEEESWARFAEEAYMRFIEHTYHGEYQKQLIQEFEARLPAKPPWA